MISYSFIMYSSTKKMRESSGVPRLRDENGLDFNVPVL